MQGAVYAALCVSNKFDLYKIISNIWLYPNKLINGSLLYKINMCYYLINFFFRLNLNILLFTSFYIFDVLIYAVIFFFLILNPYVLKTGYFKNR